MSFVYHAAAIGVKKNPVESVAWAPGDDQCRRRGRRRSMPACLRSPARRKIRLPPRKRAKEFCGEARPASPPSHANSGPCFRRRTLEIREDAAGQPPKPATSRRSTNYALLEDGQGTKVDDEAAVRWLRRASEKGQAKAQYALRLCRISAEAKASCLTPRKPTSGFRASAAQQGGDEYAERAVAMCLSAGEGVKAEAVESEKKWLPAPPSMVGLGPNGRSAASSTGTSPTPPTTPSLAGWFPQIRRTTQHRTD
jgi:hypothetical protein